jgi:hypothetical protein
MLGFFLLALFIVPIIARLSVDTVFRPQLGERNADLNKNIPKILADLEVLSAHPVFPAAVYKNNAQFLLNKYIGTNGMEITAVRNPQYFSLRKFTTIYGKWRTNPALLDLIMNDNDLMSLDTSWMQSLHEFDHWNYSDRREVIARLSSVQDVNALTRLEIFSQLPTPSFRDIRGWALLNFIKLYKSGQGYEGLKTYRHVANLLHTSGNLVASVTATFMLRDEYILLEHFHVKDWKPVPIVYVDAYYRVVWAWMAILKLPYFNEFPEAFVKYLSPQNGICAGALEAISSFTLYRDFFEPQSFFEADFSENVTFTKNLFRKIHNECNLAIYSKFLDRSPASLNPFSSFTLDEEISSKIKNTDYNFSMMDNWVYIPYVRRLVGMMYFANGSPINYLMPYETETRRKKLKGLLEDSF